jgi:hypothetical protein
MLKVAPAFFEATERVRSGIADASVCNPAERPTGSPRRFQAALTLFPERKRVEIRLARIEPIYKR